MAGPQVLLRINDNGVGNIVEPQDDRQHYVINYVEFCYEPLQDLLAHLAIAAGQLLPNQVMGGRAVPSGHHRFIHFRATGYGPPERYRGNLNEVPQRPMPAGGVAYENERIVTVWGTMEHVGGIIQVGRAECKLYENEHLPDRDEQVHRDSQGGPIAGLSISRLFSDAYKGPYRLIDNNCIDYAIRCWNRLQPNNTIEYDDVCRAPGYGYIPRN